VLVADRQLDGRSGWWLVTPLRTGEAAPAALVVRGWVADPTTPAPPAGPVTVTGRLYASEDLPPIGTGGRPALPPGQYGQVNNAELTAAFPYRILDGYVLRAGTTTPTGAPVAGEPTAVPAPVRVVDSGGGLRNLAYALQWWLFAAAVLYFWWKLVRDDLSPPADRTYEPAQPTARRPADKGSDGRVPDGRLPDGRLPDGRVPTDEVPATVAGSDAPRAAPMPGPPADASDDPEDEELAAYNRYLASLSRGGRPRS
jgi:hypothetical protein